MLSGRSQPPNSGRSFGALYASRMHWEDPDIGEGLDDDGPSAEDLDRFGDEFITCPNCSKAIYDQSEICPYCGNAVIGGDSGPGLWVIVVAAVLVIVFVVFLFR